MTRLLLVLILVFAVPADALVRFLERDKALDQGFDDSMS